MAEKTVQADLELRKGLTELQNKVQLAASQLKVAEGHIETLKREKAHAELTKREISALNPNTPTYEALGRLFIYKDVDTIQKHLDERIEASESKIKTLETSNVTIRKIFKENENNMRELVQQWKNK